MIFCLIISLALSLTFGCDDNSSDSSYVEEKDSISVNPETRGLSEEIKELEYITLGYMDSLRISGDTLKFFAPVKNGKLKIKSLIKKRDSLENVYSKNSSKH